MVGFWDAWQHGGDPRHAQAAWNAWQYIERHHVDPVGGDWFKTLDAEGRPIDAIPKAGPWECPYHHVRACLEMTERLQSR
jgi:mannobiose 2-epimerase